MKEDFYCRAAHSVLHVSLDEQVCGKGCPCYRGMKEIPICGYEEQALVENSADNPEEMWIKAEKKIQEGKWQLFPKVKGLDEKLAKAYNFAANAHRNQYRKGTKVPYFTHILTAMNYALELTDDKEVLTAVILHDTVEDTDVMLEDIEREFGPTVADYIKAESEDKRPGIPPRETWEIRKKETLEHLKTASYPIKMIVLADKAANAESLVREYRRVGESLWLKFNQTDKRKQAWYYYSCAEALTEFADSSVMKCYLAYLEELFG